MEHSQTKVDVLTEVVAEVALAEGVGIWEEMTLWRKTELLERFLLCRWEVFCLLI